MWERCQPVRLPSSAWVIFSFLRSLNSSAEIGSMLGDTALPHGLQQHLHMPGQGMLALLARALRAAELAQLPAQPVLPVQAGCRQVLMLIGVHRIVGDPLQQVLNGL